MVSNGVISNPKNAARVVGPAGDRLAIDRLAVAVRRLTG
jgi:hypothetical protein